MKKAFALFQANKRGKRGFTLVELVIVIAVLAIIAGIAIPTVHNVIENANATADGANAQAIELAIKTCQSEVAANDTTGSDAAQKVIDADPKVLSTILTNYGVDPEVLEGLKEGSGYFFLYDGASGKVTVSHSNGDITTGKVQLAKTTPYTVSGTKLTITTTT